MRRRHKTRYGHSLLPAPDVGDPKDWDVTRKPHGVSQLYLDDNEDSRRALVLIARVGLPVHQVYIADMPGPVLSTRHRTLRGLYEIWHWLRRVEAVSANGRQK